MIGCKRLKRSIEKLGEDVISSDGHSPSEEDDPHAEIPRFVVIYVVIIVESASKVEVKLNSC